MAVATCHRCPRLFETSEEIANEPGPGLAGGSERLCPWCRGPRAAARYEHPNHPTTSRGDCSACDAADGERAGLPLTFRAIGRALDRAEEEET